MVMKKYFILFIQILVFINCVAAVNYDSTLVKFRNRGDADCQTYDFSERIFLIMNGSDSIVLVQDSSFNFNIDSSFHNTSKDIFTLDNNHGIMRHLTQTWQDSIWINGYRIDGYYYSNTISYIWSIADSAWNNSERTLNTIVNDTIYFQQQTWDSINNLWSDVYISEVFRDSSLGYTSNIYYTINAGAIIWGAKTETWIDSLQNSTTNINSVYDTLSSAFIYTSRDSTVLSSTGNIIYLETQSWDTFQWINNVRNEHFVYSTYRIDANYVGNGTSWDNVNKLETYTNIANLDSIQNQYSGIGSNWRLSLYTTYSYDVNNNIDTTISQQVDSLNNYTNYERNTRSYTITNKPNVSLTEVWNGTSWVLSIQDSSWYDVADTLIGTAHSVWNGSGWDIEAQGDFTYISYFPLQYQYTYYDLNSPGDFENYSIRYDNFGRLLYRWDHFGAGLSGRTVNYAYYPDNSYSYSFEQSCTMGGLGHMEEIYYFKPFSIVLDDSLQICLGDTITTSAFTLNGTQPLTLLWEPNYNISSTSVLNPDVYPVVDTTYQLTIIDSSGNISSHSITLNVNSAIAPDIGSDTLICLNSVYSINVIGLFASYLWQDGSTSNPYSVNSGAVDTILLLLNTVDSNSCRSSDSAMVIVSVCTNLNALASSNEIIVYPNVLNQGDFVSILGEFHVPAEIIFYNFQGWNKKKSLSANGNSFRLNAPPGLLLYKIISDGNEISSGKIISLK